MQCCMNLAVLACSSSFSLLDFLVSTLQRGKMSVYPTATPPTKSTRVRGQALTRVRTNTTQSTPVSSDKEAQPFQAHQAGVTALTVAEGRSSIRQAQHVSSPAHSDKAARNKGTLPVGRPLQPYRQAVRYVASKALSKLSMLPQAPTPTTLVVVNLHWDLRGTAGSVLGLTFWVPSVRYTTQ